MCVQNLYWYAEVICTVFRGYIFELVALQCLSHVELKHGCHLTSRLLLSHTWEHVVMTTTRSKPLKQQRNTIFALKKGEKGFPLKMKCFWINGVYSDFTKFYLWKYSLHSCQKVLAQSKVGVTQRNTAQIYDVFANVRKSLNLQYL